MATLIDLPQPIRGEQTGVARLRYRGLLDRLHPNPLLFQEAAHHDAGRLVGKGRHLQVEVPGLEQHGVDWSQVDEDVVKQTQGPSLAEEDHIRVLGLKQQGQDSMPLEDHIGILGLKQQGKDGSRPWFLSMEHSKPIS